MASWRGNVVLIVTVCSLVFFGALAALHVTDWNGASYVVHFVGPLVIFGGSWWFARTRSLADVDARKTTLLASEDIVVPGLSEPEAMDLIAQRSSAPLMPGAGEQIVQDRVGGSVVSGAPDLDRRAISDR